MSILKEVSVFQEGAMATGAAISAPIFIQSIASESIMWFVLSLIFVFANVWFGIQKARYEKQAICWRKAIKRTISKICSYFIWVIIATSGSVAVDSLGNNWFDGSWIKTFIFFSIFGLEIGGCFSNWLASKGKKIKGFNLFKILSEKTKIAALKDIEITDTSPKPSKPN